MTDWRSVFSYFESRIWTTLWIGLYVLLFLQPRPSPSLTWSDCWCLTSTEWSHKWSCPLFEIPEQFQALLWFYNKKWGHTLLVILYNIWCHQILFALLVLTEFKLAPAESSRENAWVFLFDATSSHHVIHYLVGLWWLCYWYKARQSVHFTVRFDF
jgi:hypothetical protein